MWTVVYIAPNRPVAEMLREILEAEGIMASLRPIGVPHMGEAANVEILVPESEIEEAAEIINASFGS
ncbi:MAG: glutamate decarboxylase [Firmicutes bacterium]|nr:glutamate decarboxylase [Bacillota bacterium]